MATARAPEGRPGPRGRGVAARAEADRGPAPTPVLASESSRARYPDATGVAERAGGRVAWEAYGSGDPAIVFVPPWQIVHSRVWKAQIPDFARRHRVVAWDARGNGHSDRPTDPLAHTTRARASDLGAVIDAAGVQQAVLVGLSSASGPMIVFAADHPERVLGWSSSAPPRRSGSTGPVRTVRSRSRSPTKRLEQGEPPVLATRLPGLPRVLLRRGLPGGPLDQTARGRRRLRARHRPGDPCGDGPRPELGRPPDADCHVRRGSLPVLVIQGTDERIST